MKMKKKAANGSEDHVDDRDKQLSMGKRRPHVLVVVGSEPAEHGQKAVKTQTKRQKGKR